MEVELEGEIQTLRDRVRTLEVEAEATGQLQRQINDLKGQLDREANGQAEMGQRVIQWQMKFGTEQAARRESERQAEGYRAQISQWQREYRVLQSQIDAATQVIANLRAELRQIEALKVWAGHPCSICRKPMSGSIDRALAAQMMKELAHKGWLERQGSGLGKVLLAGGTLLGLSQLGKR